MKGVRKQSDLSTRRRGLIIVELVISLPIIVIFLAAVIEFGLIIVGLQQVSLASRMGAKVAAEDFDLSIGGNSPVVVARVQTAVDRVLATGGIGDSSGSGNSCTVQLRHNVPPDPPDQVYTAGGSCPCTPPTTNIPPTAPPYYVRVTVCVELSKLSPNFLRTFGFDIANKYAEHTTTYPYEP